MQGDLLFYYRKPSVFDRLIQWWTGSRFYHVAIDVGNNYKIEAIGSGIKRSLIIDNIDFERWVYSEHTTDADPNDMVTATNWLRVMENHEYGWQDVATAANPLRKFFYIVSPNHYDCAALAVEFLILAGGVDVEKILDTHLQTPGSLAKALGVV